MTSSKTWADAAEVLAVRLDSIGDVVMTGPALRALAAGGPAGRRVTLLTSPAGAPAAELLPGVDEVIPYEAPWIKASAERGPEPDLAMAELLRARGFDAGAIFTVYSQSPLPAALLLHLAGVPLRLAHCRENPYQLLSHHVPETEPEAGVRHEVRRQLDLVAAVGEELEDERLGLRLPAGAAEGVGAMLDAEGLERGRPWLVVNPGATAPSRRYPAELLAEACALLGREHGVQLVFTGDEADTALVRGIREAIGVPSIGLTGRLRLDELAALLALAPVLVSGNSGPVHLAAAMGTPVVDIYALTNPQHTPWGVENRVLSRDVPCRWCYSSVCPEGHHRCLRGVAPSSVADAAVELLRIAKPHC